MAALTPEELERIRADLFADETPCNAPNVIDTGSFFTRAYQHLYRLLSAYEQIAQERDALARQGSSFRALERLQAALPAESMAGVASSFHVGAEAAIVHIGRLTAERDFLHEQVVNLAREQDALRAEVGIPASYWSEYFEAGVVRSREQVTTDHDRMWWDWLQQVKARGWKDSPSPTPTEPKEE